MALLLIIVGCAAAGFAIGRWIALLVPLAAWACVTGFLVLNDGWYGQGWGDYGVELNVFAALLSVAATGLAVGFRRISAEPVRPRRL